MADNQNTNAIPVPEVEGVEGSIHAPEPTHSGEKKKCHLAKPAVFSGKEFKGWWRSVQLYILANERDFTIDRDRILFALSFMTDGLAEKWSQNYTDWAMDKMDGHFGS